MFYSYKDTKVLLNNYSIHANDAQISVGASLEPIFLIHDRTSFDSSPTQNVQGSARFTYYLTGKDNLKTHIKTNDKISGYFGGLYFESGYLRSYNINCIPNTPIVANAEIVFFEALKGEFTPTTDTTDYLHVLNFSDASVTLYPSYSEEKAFNIASLDYSYESEIQPVHGIPTGTQQSGVFPMYISFGPRYAIGTLSIDSLSGDMSIYGKNAAFTVSLNHPTIPDSSDSFTISGKLSQKEIGSSNQQYTRNIIQIRQDNVYESPKISQVLYLSPPSLPGGKILISGTNLKSTTYLKIGDTPFTDYKILSDILISGTVPYDALTGRMYVRAGGGESYSTGNIDLTFVNPIINEVYPISGGTGTNVLISGSGINRISHVKFGDYYTDFRRINSTTLTASVPPLASHNTVTILSSGRGTSGTSPFKFVTYPIITGLSSTTGMSGSSVTIMGSRFSGITDITFNNISVTGFTVENHNSIVTYLPTGNATGAIKIFIPSGLSFSSNVNFYPSITLTGISPQSGKVNTSITGYGQNFHSYNLYNVNSDLYKVKLGGVITGFGIVNSWIITGTIPSTATSGNLQIYQSDGVSTYSDSIMFIKRYEAPYITSISPTYAFSGEKTTSGTRSLRSTIYGQNFYYVSNVVLTGISGAAAIGETITVPSTGVSTNVWGQQAILLNYPLTGIQTGWYNMGIVTSEGSGYATGSYYSFNITTGST